MLESHYQSLETLGGDCTIDDEDFRIFFLTSPYTRYGWGQNLIGAACTRWGTLLGGAPHQAVTRVANMFGTGGPCSVRGWAGGRRRAIPVEHTWPHWQTT